MFKATSPGEAQTFSYLSHLFSVQSQLDPAPAGRVSLGFRCPICEMRRWGQCSQGSKALVFVVFTQAGRGTGTELTLPPGAGGKQTATFMDCSQAPG